MSKRRPLDEPEIVRRLRAGESQRAVGRALDLNPVTVGYVARRHGITYPRAARQAEAHRGQGLRQPERSWQAQVIELATMFGWRTYHTWNSKHSTAGFPDLVLVKLQPDGLARHLIAELKADSGRLMPAQETWLDLLSHCRGVEVFVWQPRDAQTVADILQWTIPWTGATRIWPGDLTKGRSR